jgi:hypothetical protein
MLSESHMVDRGLKLREDGSATIVLAAVACFAWGSHGYSAFAQKDVESNLNTIALELRDNLAPVLIAKIDGVEVPLQFDLGDRTPLILQRRALDAIKAVPTGESIKLQGTDGDFEVPTYKVPRVQIGDAVFTDVTARLDAPRVGYEPAQFARGYLGSGLLKSNAVVLDYAHHSMTLLRGEGAALQELCRGTVVTFSVSSPKWRGEAVTESDTDFGRVTLWWDTGSPATALSKSASHASHLPTSTERVVTHRFMLGGSNFGPWPLNILNVSLPGFDGFIGDDFFKKHRVCIDFPGNRIVIGH